MSSLPAGKRVCWKSTMDQGKMSTTTTIKKKTEKVKLKEKHYDLHCTFGAKCLQLNYWVKGIFNRTGVPLNWTEWCTVRHPLTELTTKQWANFEVTMVNFVLTNSPLTVNHGRILGVALVSTFPRNMEHDLLSSIWTKWETILISCISGSFTL